MIRVICIVFPTTIQGRNGPWRTADQEAWPASWMSMILHNRDLRSHFSDGEPALSLDCIGWVEASRSPFYIEGDLEGTPVSFSPSVRKM